MNHRCLFCGGDRLSPLGAFGDMVWYRCQNCGSDVGVKTDDDSDHNNPGTDKGETENE